MVVRPGPASFEPIAEICISGDVDIDRTFSLGQVPEALAQLGEGRALGKVIVQIG